MTTFLWVTVPYACLAVFVVGHAWRYRYDTFGWTTRSIQLYEDRLLRIGSPPFHLGMLRVVLGTVIVLPHPPLPRPPLQGRASGPRLGEPRPAARLGGARAVEGMTAQTQPRSGR